MDSSHQTQRQRPFLWIVFVTQKQVTQLTFLLTVVGAMQQQKVIKS